MVASIESLPLVPFAGGWNLAEGPVPGVRDAHPTGTTHVSVMPPSGPVAQQDPSIDVFTHFSPLALAMRFELPIDAGAAPGTYAVGAAEAGGLGASFAVPCPPLANEPPHAAVGGPYAGEVGVPIALDGSASSDPEDAGLGYQWYFEDGTTLTGPNPSRTFDAPGTYLVLLVVNDGELYSPTSTGAGSYTTVTIGGGDACTAEPRTATFASIACRLEALRTRTAGLAVTAKLMKRLRSPLDAAGVQLAESRTFCGIPKKMRRAKSKLGRVARKVAQFGRRFRSRAAHKELADAVRADFMATAEPIRADAVAFRGVLQCPADVTGP